MHRLRELDFLRGIAIMLVLFRHQLLFGWLQNMGWIGVDLFFVLSGFLVSGLLFKEYLKYGSIKPFRFLIRRGFKIYPIYYIFYLPYLFNLIIYTKINFAWLFSDLFFIQNYTRGWGYAFTPSWSLAIEEHFYFGFSAVLLLITRQNKILLKPDNNQPWYKQFETTLLFTMVLCLGMRFVSNMVLNDNVRNFTMTHLRIDSLLMGVFISYIFYFKPGVLQNLVARYKYVLGVVCLAGLCWTPFVDAPVASFFVRTIGFSLLYISFGTLLVLFLCLHNINEKLNSVFSKPLVSLVSKIGFCSYSIYIIHDYIDWFWASFISHFHFHFNHYFNFVVTASCGIAAGMLMTYYIESYFLKQREKYYPSRAA